MSDYKSSNFLNAIRKFNEEERKKLVSEMETKKDEAIREAKLKGEFDADKYVKKHLSAEKARITGEYAVKNLEARGEVFKTRAEMFDTVFERSAEKLIHFTSTPEYRDKLIDLAREIAEAFKENSCIIYVKEDDLKYENDIKSVFSGSVEVKTDVKIRIGGLRGYCKELRIVADNTLDSKLENQRTRFVENTDLKIS